MKRWLIVWWFAAVSASGEATFHEYYEKKACQTAQHNYERVTKTTKCAPKGNHEPSHQQNSQAS